MKLFTRNETIGVLIILLIVFVITTLNLKIAIRRSRDAQRRADIGAIDDALGRFQKDFGFFPPSTSDGKILACKGSNFDEVLSSIKKENNNNTYNILRQGLRGCNWGEDSFRDVTDESYSPYIEKLPSDPRAYEGLTYIYLSNTNRYQLFAYLEGGNGEEGYRQGIVARNIFCGKAICNFGKAYGDTPLEKSIEEYENEIRKNSKT
jgi:type II secretory pathway pseudopilin PulG